MNKMMKAAVATGLGVTLLLGGAGSLALWNASANVGAAQNIASGELTLEATGAWDSEPLTKWVPGDKKTYTATVKIVAVGDNMDSHFSIDLASLTGGADLKNALSVNLALTDITGGSLTETGADTNIFKVKPSANGNGTITAQAVVTVELPLDVSNDLAQGEQVSLQDLAFQLKQVRA
ncbi:alternate-type signal peptide domain-containing protein [Leucobacter insecticola]|uniref:Alternate-type signal peptide domain-containing protein n=1 Tax=Leucobacter insecticola TaxID=2714934 RepID=A0A6G8FKG2_9MICO|nr:alternate-type signal peptide domain-containing protein [Leucobacter insecticola]QIM16838.1 alternate-type signal peptide domain-containing protein [Leucobacter insecticola]